MVAQAVPSVSPFYAAEYLHKVECFCFNQQILEAGESIEMPLRFFVDTEIPGRVSKLTLSYTLFNLPDVAAN
jgi:cytochrome c oxidase assembly protein subunit 11